MSIILSSKQLDFLSNMRHSGTEFYTGQELDIFHTLGRFQFIFLILRRVYTSETILGQIISVLSVVPPMVSEFGSRVI
jgi:hypothetical protein